MNITPKDKLLNLDGKVVIVTGSTVGIGYGIAYRLGEAGAKVILSGRDLGEGKKAEEELTAKGYQVKFIKVDVSIEEEVKTLVAESIKAFGRIDILINNAGIFPFLPLAQMTTADFEKVINTNLKGVFLMTKYVSSEMIKKGEGGKIINITSIDALHPSMAGLAHYDASKHGVWGFTKNVALELSKNNIWVNAVAPGGIMTHGVAVAQSQGKPVELPRNPDPPKMEIAMGRMGVPDDIGKVVLFLASDMASYMTGSQIVVDGGYLLK